MVLKGTVGMMCSENNGGRFRVVETVECAKTLFKFFAGGNRKENDGGEN